MKRTATLFSLIALSLSASACSVFEDNLPGGSEDQQSTASQEDVEKQFQEEVAKLSWPQGKKPSTFPEADSGSSYQSGYAVAISGSMWECAWKSEWLDKRSSSPEEANAALKILESTKEMKHFTSSEFADDNTRELFNSNLESAKMSDPIGFAQDVKQNC